MSHPAKRVIRWKKWHAKGKGKPLPLGEGYYWLQFEGDDAAQPVFYDPESNTFGLIGMGDFIMLDEMGSFSISTERLPRTKVLGTTRAEDL